MMYIIISLLVASQIVGFYLIFNKIKPFIKPKVEEGILLKPIPQKVNYEDVDTNLQLVKDLMETIKLEEWKVEVKPDYGIGMSYDVNFTSHSGDVSFINKIGFRGFDEMKDPCMRICHIRSTDGNIVIDRDKPISTDILIFLWDYVIKYHEDENLTSTKHYTETIKLISAKLKTLNRNRKLNEIL